MGDYIGKPKTPPSVAFRGSLLSLDLGPLLGAMKSRRAKLEEQKCSPSAEGCLLRRAQGAARPLNPRQGVPPCTARSYKRLPATLPGPSPRGRGAGEERPGHPAGRLGRSGRVKGPCPRPYGAAGRTNPLTRPSLKKRARGPRRGLEGHCRSGWGSRLAQRPRSGLALTPRNDPNAPGWWLGVLFPPAACHVANAPGGPPEALLPLIFASEVWGFRGAARPLNQVTKEPTKRSAGRALCVSWL